MVIQKNLMGELDEAELDQLRTKGEVLQFATMLTKAQAVAVEVKREQAKLKPTRKHHYTGNSVCIKWYHAQKRQQLALTGQKFIGHWLKRRESSPDNECYGQWLGIQGEFIGSWHRGAHHKGFSQSSGRIYKYAIKQ
jgi:hypothetical protein